MAGLEGWQAGVASGGSPAGCAHSPVNCGCRFSLKAFSPSSRSWVGMTCNRREGRPCPRVPAASPRQETHAAHRPKAPGEAVGGALGSELPVLGKARQRQASKERGGGHLRIASLLHAEAGGQVHLTPQPYGRLGHAQGDGPALQEGQHTRQAA